MFANHIFISLVIRMHCNELTRAQQFWTCCGYFYLSSFFQFESYVIQLRFSLSVLDLCVCNGGSASRAPVNGVLCFINKTFFKHLYERELRYPSIIGGICLIIYCGVHALPQDFVLMNHLPNVLSGKILAQLYEFLPGCFMHLYSIFFLHIHLYGHAINVEAKREEYFKATHSLVPCNNVYMRIMHRMSNVQLSTCISWWDIDAEHGLLRIKIKMVNFLLLPVILPFLLDLFEIVHGWVKRQGNIKIWGAVRSIK